MPTPSPTPAPLIPALRRGPLVARATLGLALVVVIWAVNFSVIKVALVELPPLAFNALRFPLAGITLYLLLRSAGPVPLPQGADRWRVLGLGLLGNMIYQIFFITGLEHAHAGIASLLLAGTPVMTAILSAAVGHEHVGPRMWAAVAATFGGMALVVLGGQLPGGGGAPLWANLLMLCASASWAVYTVGSSRLIERYGPLAFTAWTLWWGAAGLFLTGIPQLLSLDFAHVSAATWGGVAYSGVLSIALAYSLWYYGVRHLGNTRTAVFNNLVPVAALAVAWAWLGEVPTAFQLAGAAVIIAGVSLGGRTR